MFYSKCVVCSVPDWIGFLPVHWLLFSIADSSHCYNGSVYVTRKLVYQNRPADCVLFFFFSDQKQNKTTTTTTKKIKKKRKEKEIKIMWRSLPTYLNTSLCRRRSGQRQTWSDQTCRRCRRGMYLS